MLCSDAGLSIEAAAKALHVTPRTIRNWFSGKVSVPYAAYRLVRILGRFELPDPAWHGWLFHSGKLWSPEGHGFAPADSSWWNLLVRRARLFHQMVDRQHALDALLLRAGRHDLDAAGAAGGTRASGGVPGAPAGAGAGREHREAGRAAEPPGPNLLLEHFGTGEACFIGKTPSSAVAPGTSVSTNKEGGHDV